MKGRIVLVPGILLVALLALGAYLARPGPSSSQPKSLPIPQGGDRNWGLTSAQIERARQLAMADRQVLTLLKGKRYQFINALPTGQKFDGEMAVCAQHTCGQVEIYNFTDNATVSAIADLDAGRVFLVQEIPNSYPNVNAELAEQAIRIARSDPKVLAQTKGRRFETSMAPASAWLADSPCMVHWCVGPTFEVEGTDDHLLVFVDLTEMRVVDTRWLSYPDRGDPMPMHIPSGCPAPGTVNQNGWSLSYETTGNDGFRVYNVTYRGRPVFRDAKMVQVDVGYAGGTWGYHDSVGCSAIQPYGETQILPIEGGFRVTQDFRMGGWGGNCAYRYQQYFDFYNDGRFRIRVDSFGRGCSTDGVYRPGIRVDIGPGGEAGNVFKYYGNSFAHTGWFAPALEGGFHQGNGPYDLGNRKWQQLGADGQGYWLEPRNGTNLEVGPPDNARYYVLQFHAGAEGDQPNLPTQTYGGYGCTPDCFPGQPSWMNGEPIQNQNLVLWYIAQSQTNPNPPNYWCWTVSQTQTYPCPSGPMYHTGEGGLPFPFPSPTPNS